MEQQGYFHVFRERWIAILAGLVLGAGIAALFATLLPPTYSATATLILSVESADGTLSDRSQYSLDRIGSYPELAFSEEVLELTIDDLGLDLSPEQLSGYITAGNPETTMLLQIGAEARSAQTAADIANSVATNVATVVFDIENSANDQRFRTTLDLRNPARPPTDAAGPQASIILGLGILAGLAAGLIAAIIWARLDNTVRSIGQVRAISGLPVLGELPALSAARPHAGGKFAAQRARHTALLREAQLAIRQANAGTLPRLLLLVPAGPTAGGVPERQAIARAVASTGRSVCLLENEAASRPDAASAAGQRKGMTEVLGSSLALRDAIHAVDGEPFSVVYRGEASGAVTEKTVEERIGAVAADLRAAFDCVIVEATSLTHPMSLELVAPYSDGVVVLARYGRTHSAELAHAAARVRLTGLRPLGVLLTGVPTSRLEDVVAGWLPQDFAAAPAAPPAAPPGPSAIGSSPDPT